MLTIFALPKPFHGHSGVIQTNAIRSWLLLRPKCEIILFGKDEGTAEFAAEYGVRHIPEVACSDYGTPLVNSIFSIAQESAGNNLMCYVNADIILTGDFMPSMQRAGNGMFLMIGRRSDLDVNELIDFDNPDWEKELQERRCKEGKLHAVSGIDYFVFPRGLYRSVPSFAIGRTAWDNWLVYWARYSKVPVIDATRAVTAVHQNHDYGHHPQGAVGIWKGPESIRNVALMGGMERGFTIAHATVRLTSQGLQTPLTLRYFYHRLRAVPALHPRLRFLFKSFQVFEKVLAATKSITPKPR